MQNSLLLLEDVKNLGRKGDIVKAKPGFVRNFLLPKQKAVVATKQTLRMRERLQEERAKQAAVDKKEAQELAKVIEGKTLSVDVKVDPAGHLYGSVTAADIVSVFEKEGVDIEKTNVILPQPLRKLGKHEVSLKLKEGVPATVFIEVKPEPGSNFKIEVKSEEESKEEAASEGSETEEVSADEVDSGAESENES